MTVCDYCVAGNISGHTIWRICHERLLKGFLADFESLTGDVTKWQLYCCCFGHSEVGNKRTNSRTVFRSRPPYLYGQGLWSLPSSYQTLFALQGSHCTAVNLFRLLRWESVTRQHMSSLQTLQQGHIAWNGYWTYSRNNSNTVLCIVCQLCNGQNIEQINLADFLKITKLPNLNSANIFRFICWCVALA